MLAYRVHAPVAYDPALTMLSLLLAIAGTQIGFAIASVRRWTAAPPVGGFIVGLAIAGMHYVGMLAYRIDGIVEWRVRFVALSVVFSVVLSTMSLSMARRPRKDRSVSVAPALMIAAILSLHFTGMAAIRVIPLGRPPQSLGQSADLLAAATVLVALLVVLAGSFAFTIDERHRAHTRREIARAGLLDQLTGLPNGEAFEAELHRLGEAILAGEGLLVAVLAISRFGEVIERHGPRAGNSVLCDFSRQLVALRKAGIFIARTDLAEFCMLTPLGREEDTRPRLERGIANLPRSYGFETLQIVVSPRVGIARFPKDAANPDAALRHARLALARALEDPFQTVASYDGFQDAARLRRLVLADDIGGALEHGEFELVCQPQVEISGRDPIGYEVLLRWRHPALGLVPPDEFIPIAESTGDIIAIGRWVLEEACKAAARWPSHLRVAVNVSPLQLQQPEFFDLVSAALDAARLAPERLEIEITESLLINDREQALAVLRRIQSLGVRLALDDFGTGYSSMDVLRYFPFDTVKLDKSFVADIVNDPRSLMMLHAIMAMGRTLGIPVLAEGVETEAQLEILRGSDCQNVQGFLTGRPMPIGAVPMQQTLRLAG